MENNFAEMTIAEMLNWYNDRVAELLELGGTSRVRKTFKDRSEAEAYCKTIAGRLKAHKEGLAALEKQEKGEDPVSENEEKAPRIRKSRAAADEVKPMRAGTIRARILELMDGTRTPIQIAAEVGIEEHKVPAHLNALHKHSGVGFEFDADDRVTAVYPRGANYSSAIKEAEAA